MGFYVLLYCQFFPSAVLLSLSRAPRLSWNVPTDAGFLCDKAPLLGAAKKIHSVVLITCTEETRFENRFQDIRNLVCFTNLCRKVRTC